MHTPRPYQIEAKQRILDEFTRVYSTLLVLPTGTGKTVVFAQLANEWQQGSVLVLAHRDELIRQAQGKLAEELGYAPQIEKAADYARPAIWDTGRQQVVVGSVQTLCREHRLRSFKERFAAHPFGLVIYDEAHHCTASSYLNILRFFRDWNPDVKVLGVTATPKRADKAAMGIVFETCAHQVQISGGIADGWLVPISQGYFTNIEVDWGQVGTSTNSLAERDINPADLEAQMLAEKELHCAAKTILEQAGKRPTIIFTPGVVYAYSLADVLNRYKPGSAAAVSGETKEDERKAIVAAFQAGQVQYVANCQIFTEGFDAPATACIVMARGTKSIGLYQQMLGRGTRPLPGLVDGPPTAEERRAAIAASGKPNMLVLDLVGNSRHKLVSAVDVLGGESTDEVRQMAQRQLATRPGNVDEALEEAEKAVETRKRRQLAAQSVRYERREVDPFEHDGEYEEQPAPKKVRGGSSNAQIDLLVRLGVNRSTAEAYTLRQASAVIGELKKKRCTVKQALILQRFGENPKVNYETASAIIDEIQRNGWQPRKKKQEAFA